MPTDPIQDINLTDVEIERANRIGRAKAQTLIDATSNIPIDEVPHMLGISPRDFEGYFFNYSGAALKFLSECAYYAAVGTWEKNRQKRTAEHYGRVHEIKVILTVISDKKTSAPSPEQHDMVSRSKTHSVLKACDHLLDESISKASDYLNEQVQRVLSVPYPGILFKNNPELLKAVQKYQFKF